MLLTKYKGVPSGMSFVLDTGPAPRLAYLLSTPGAAAVVTVQGTGVWAVEILSSIDGVNFTPLATKTTPGQWRYDVQAINAVAVRLASYTNGQVTGMLTHGGAAPITNVSSLFGAFLIFSYNSTPSEPPTGNQIRFNSTSMPAVTKVWIANSTTDGTDQFQALRKLPNGGTLLVQDRNDHTKAVLLNIVGLPVDKGPYIELSVVYQEHLGVLSSAQTLVATFNPGPVLSLTPTTPAQLPYHPRPAPVLSALDPPAAPLGSPSFTLRVVGGDFNADDVIIWNGGVEPTTFLSDTELTTGVNMDTAVVAMPIPVQVETTDGLRSNTLTFDLGGYPPPPAVARRQAAPAPPAAFIAPEPAPVVEPAAEPAEPEPAAEPPKPRRKRVSDG